jgi:hypothetical protein
VKVRWASCEAREKSAPGSGTSAGDPVRHRHAIEFVHDALGDHDILENFLWTRREFATVSQAVDTRRTPRSGHVVAKLRIADVA